MVGFLTPLPWKVLLLVADVRCGQNPHCSDCYKCLCIHVDWNIIIITFAFMQTERFLNYFTANARLALTPLWTSEWGSDPWVGQCAMQKKMKWIPDGGLYVIFQQSTFAAAFAWLSCSAALYTTGAPVAKSTDSVRGTMSQHKWRSTTIWNHKCHGYLLLHFFFHLVLYLYSL